LSSSFKKLKVEPSLHDENLDPNTSTRFQGTTPERAQKDDKAVNNQALLPVFGNASKDKTTNRGILKVPGANPQEKDRKSSCVFLRSADYQGVIAGRKASKDDQKRKKI